MGITQQKMISISVKQEIIPVSFNSHRIPCVQAGSYHTQIVIDGKQDIFFRITSDQNLISIMTAP